MGCLLGNVQGIDICGKEGKETGLGRRRKEQQCRRRIALADSTESSGTNMTPQSCPAQAKGRLSHPASVSLWLWGHPTKGLTLGEMTFSSRGSPQRWGTAKESSWLTALPAAGATSALEGGSGRHSSVSITGVFLTSTVQVKHKFWDFPSGPVVKNPPANAGDTGSIPGPGRSHMPRATKPVHHDY